MTARPGRSTADWVALAVSTAILAVVFGLVVVQLRNPDAPPEPVAQVQEVRRVGGGFHVDVVVRNDGDQTAANVQVDAEVQTPEGPVGGDQTIDFLPGGDEQLLTFVFVVDPTSADLAVTVTGFADP